MKWLLLLVMLLVLSIGQPIKAQRVRVDYVKTSVCHADSSKVAAQKLNVRLDANVISDLRHGAFLVDKSCPDHALRLGVNADNADSSVAKFDEVLGYDCPPNSVRRKLSATFYGRLQLGKILPLNRKRPEITIELMRVENLEDVNTGCPVPPSDEPAPPILPPQ